MRERKTPSRAADRVLIGRTLTVASFSLVLLIAGSLSAQTRREFVPDLTIHSGGNFDMSVSGEPGGRCRDGHRPGLFGSHRPPSEPSHSPRI